MDIRSCNGLLPLHCSKVKSELVGWTKRLMLHVARCTWHVACCPATQIDFNQHSPLPARSHNLLSSLANTNNKKYSPQRSTTTTAAAAAAAAATSTASTAATSWGQSERGRCFVWLWLAFWFGRDVWQAQRSSSKLVCDFRFGSCKKKKAKSSTTASRAALLLMLLISCCRCCVVAAAAAAVLLLPLLCCCCCCCCVVAAAAAAVLLLSSQCKDK